MIKRIELVNFMSHEHSVFELTEGLNVLVGPNNCGKSAVVTALQILCYNDNSTYVMRHDTRQCSVTVETEDGHTIRWARKKSGAPWYEINGQKFDRLRGSVPVQVHEALRMQRVTSEKDRFDVHFGEQKQPVFLLNDKPRQAADFFASSSDARYLLEMQNLHKQRVREAQSSHDQLQRESAELKAELNQLKIVDELSNQWQKCAQQERAINRQVEQTLHLGIDFQAIKHHRQLIQSQDRSLDVLKELPAPPEFVDESSLADLVSEMLSANERMDQAEKRLRVLNELQRPKLTDQRPIDELAILIRQMRTAKHARDIGHATEQALQALAPPPKPQSIDDLQSVIHEINSAAANLRCVSDELVEAGSRLQQTREQWKQWIAENPECPTCGNELTASQITSQGTRCHD